jgi:predicted HTH transcriptional regulator
MVDSHYVRLRRAQAGDKLRRENSEVKTTITEQQVLDDTHRDERPRVEFKRSFIKTSDLAETIMAFANAEGGTIYLGVDDGPPPHLSGRIKQVTKEDRDNIHRSARDILVPPVPDVTTHEVEVQGKRVLAIVAPRSHRTHQHRNGKILIRRGSENVALRGEALHEAWVQREQLGFDDRPDPIHAKSGCLPRSRGRQPLRPCRGMTLR